MVASLALYLAAAATVAAGVNSNITVGPFALQLNPQTQVVSFLALSNEEDGFAFSHGGSLSLGDVSIRVRPASWPLKTRTQPASFAALSPFPLWSGFRTASAASVTPLPLSGPAIASADLTRQLISEEVDESECNSDNDSGSNSKPPPPTAPPLAFTLQRRWERGSDNASLVLRFTIRNNATEPLPFPWAAGTDAGDKASTFVDPSITGQHGFATVTRLSGKKEILMITNGWSSSKTRTTLEAWRAADEFNGGTGLLKTHAWMCHSKAYATSEWSTSGKQWIEPSSTILQPKGSPGGSDTAEYSLVFSIASTVRDKDAALSAAGNALVLGVPGYILGADMATAKLLAQPPPGASIVSAVADEPDKLKVGTIAPADLHALGGNRWMQIPLRALADGRPRLTLQYSDGTSQASTTFFNGTKDPFKRGPSMMPWDRELKQHVTDDPRTFVVGLSDDAGAGANVGYASKVRYRPTQVEVDKLNDYIEHTLWGGQPDGVGIPVSLQDQSTFGVKSSMFWSVTSKEINETGMPGFNKDFAPYRITGSDNDCRRSLGSSAAAIAVTAV
eukprot:gene4751-35113_t